MIAAYEGDTVAAARDFAKHYASEMNITVLVDWENDSTKTAVEVADALGEDLWGVRLDTSGTVVDRSLWHEMGTFKPTGVNERLVEKVRAALDAAGHEHVRIVVSGGFTVDRIKQFEAEGIPVDAYGVGSSLIRGDNDYTADVVRVNGRPCSKVGRGEWDSSRLSDVH
jgi:nicotinate phosphoribosyltransferase